MSDLLPIGTEIILRGKHPRAGRLAEIIAYSEDSKGNPFYVLWTKEKKARSAGVYVGDVEKYEVIG